MIDVFDDGILWVTLGQTPNLLNELIKLHAALTGERPGFVDVEDAARELALRLENKNCLIVIDDAWSVAHVAPFLRAGPALRSADHDPAVRGRRRRPPRRRRSDGAGRKRLSCCSPEPAWRLDDAEPFRRLAARLGEWPLPIKLAGSAMRQRLGPRRQPGQGAGLRLAGASTSAASPPSTRPTPSNGMMRSRRTVGASLDLLTADEQHRCARARIFPENTGDSAGRRRRLWHLDDIDSEDLARKLDDLALLEFDLRLGTLRVHDVLRAFLAAGELTPGAAMPS